MTIITYHYRGRIERGCTKHGKPSYQWKDGYSANGDNGGVLYPWMTRRECQQDAKASGARAKFEDGS